MCLPADLLVEFEAVSRGDAIGGASQPERLTSRLLWPSHDGGSSPHE